MCQRPRFWNRKSLLASNTRGGAVAMCLKPSVELQFHGVAWTEMTPNIVLPITANYWSVTQLGEWLMTLQRDVEGFNYTQHTPTKPLFTSSLLAVMTKVKQTLAKYHTYDLNSFCNVKAVLRCRFTVEASIVQGKPSNTTVCPTGCRPLVNCWPELAKCPQKERLRGSFGLSKSMIKLCEPILCLLSSLALAPVYKQWHLKESRVCRWRAVLESREVSAEPLGWARTFLSGNHKKSLNVHFRWNKPVIYFPVKAGQPDSEVLLKSII